MKILALDTSTEVCSVALQVDGDVLYRFDDSGRKNTDIILPIIDELMAEAGLKPQQLDCISFARGPGGFTGVRVATGVAQGIAFGADLPVAPVSTLAMLAYGAHQQTQANRIYAINDARMGEVYAAAYEISESGELLEVIKECVSKPAELAYPHYASCNAQTPAIPGGLPLWDSGLVVGSGWAVYQENLREALAQTQWTVNKEIKPEAKYLLAITEKMQVNDQLVSAEQALPVYLRDNVAKKKKDR